MLKLETTGLTGNTNKRFITGLNFQKILILFTASTFLLSSCDTNTDRLEVVKLENTRVAIEITPGLGGRVLAFSLKDHDNLLKTGSLVQSMPNPEVSEKSENIAYLGHINWVGPQTLWWTQQKANMQRYKEKALWPPDPYIIFSKNRIIEHSSDRLVIEGVKSPVSGVQLEKSFFLPDDNQAIVQLDVAATNIREEKVAWDLWFNTRVFSSTKVYVPVASHADVRVNSFLNEITAPVEYSLVDGVLSFDISAPPPGKIKREGKLHIQPSRGWMAGFTDDQVLIIKFQLHPKELIHPDQGQVELYLKHQPNDLQEGLIEMQVHSPFLTLAPGESMRARELWEVLPYAGGDSRNAHADFLREYFSQLEMESNDKPDYDG
jgi:hypothetical protein